MWRTCTRKTQEANSSVAHVLHLLVSLVILMEYRTTLSQTKQMAVPVTAPAAQRDVYVLVHVRHVLVLLASILVRTEMCEASDDYI